MTFQDYVEFIAQQYRIGVAIAVMQAKPDNVSIEEYLIQVQNKIKDAELDPNETVCSDDFKYDEDDISKEKTNSDNRCDKLNENRMEHESEGSQTILNDFVFGDGRPEVNVEGETSIGDTLRLLKEVAKITQEEHNANQNLSQLTFCETQEDINNANLHVTNSYDPNSNAIEDHNKLIQNANESICMDSQETQLYTLHGFTQDYTHVSQTQNEYFAIADKYIRNKVNNSTHIQGNANDKKVINVHNMQTCITDQNLLTITDDGRESIVESNYVQKAVETDCDNTKSQFLQNVDKEFRATNNGVNKDDNNGQWKVNIQNVDNTNIELNVNNVSTTDKFRNNQSHEPSKVIYNDRFKTNDIAKLKDTVIENGTPLVSFKSQNTVRNECTPRNETQNIGIEHKDTNLKDRRDNKEITQENQNSTNIENVQPEFNDNMEVDETGSEEDTQETVPFKVIEELNRVKNFVNKKDRRYDGCSTDSGYRSDSQPRSSLKTSTLLHGAWLNQSAHCLISHILQATAADDFVKQIAQVLGKLIDKLHDEENYPQFLEELLDTVDSILLDLRVGGEWADNVLITKDEKIKRLLLLNKSKHILKYSIEKINIVLEQLHTNLTQDLYELTNVMEVENICYIFHILETLLKRYVKVKNTSNQSTQNSQEASLPTRSSLTELWRKKWYPNSNKEIIKNESKTCVLKRCSEILNKIIVECMDGYSLVAFTALQCFNLIQG